MSRCAIRYSAKETYNLKEPTNRRHPIHSMCPEDDTLLTTECPEVVNNVSSSGHMECIGCLWLVGSFKLGCLWLVGSFKCNVTTHCFTVLKTTHCFTQGVLKTTHCFTQEGPPDPIHRLCSLLWVCVLLKWLLKISRCAILKMSRCDFWKCLDAPLSRAVDRCDAGRRNSEKSVSQSFSTVDFAAHCLSTISAGWKRAQL